MSTITRRVSGTTAQADDKASQWMNINVTDKDGVVHRIGGIPLDGKGSSSIGKKIIELLEEHGEQAVLEGVNFGITFNQVKDTDSISLM